MALCITVIKIFLFSRYNVCLIGIGTYKKEYKSSLLLENKSKTIDSSLEDHHLYENSAHNIDLTCMSKRNIQLNPGSQYQIEAQDLCFYISLVKEENYEFKTRNQENDFHNSLNNCELFFSQLVLLMNLRLTQSIQESICI